MSQRRATAVAEPSDKRRPAPSSASIISSAAGSSSSTSNLQPFEGLSSPEIAFIDAIIRRVPTRDTNFVPVFKAYQDEFEARGQNATNDEFYFNLLLKLGMIRADNWKERWRAVCEYWGYEASFPLEEEEMSEDLGAPGALHEHTPKQRDVIRRVDHDIEDGEDDAFTLHSGGESAQYSADVAPPPPPSYHSKKPAKPSELPPSRINPTTERIVSSSTLSRVDTRLGAGATRRRRIVSITLHDGTQHAPQDDDEDPSPTPVVPPPYHTNPRVRRTSTRVSDQVAVSTQEGKHQTRDDAETWRIIQMERDADMFRREFLLSCCLDVWVKGLRWVEETSTRLDNARTQFLLQSVVTRWRSRATAAIEETKRAAMVDRVRLLNSTLRAWRLRAWTERRKRWAEGMRAKMAQMQEVVHRRVLEESLLKWNRAHRLTSASRHRDLALLHSALGKWNRRLYRIVDLSLRGEELAKHADSVILERAFGTWKRRVHFNVASKIIKERVGERVVSNALVLWRQKTHVYSVASGFNDARILRETMQKWIRRRARIQHLERRAIAHQNKPLIRAVLRIWLTQTRQKRYEALRDQRLKAKALRLWLERVQANRAKEDLAVQFSGGVDKHLTARYLSIWANRLARRRKLERRAQRAFEATVKAKALIQWRSVMWAHAKQVKQAKLVRRLFLTRLAWKRWRDVVEARRWEQSRVKMERKALKRALDAWRERARIQRGLRRKGEVVKMANEARLVKEALQAWTLRVVYLKDREYSVIQENRERVLRAFLAQWKKKLNQQQENTSLMVSFQDVRREENMRQVLNHWLQATCRKRSLAEREEELNRAVLSQAYDKWRDKFLENNLRPAELDVLLQSQTNLLFKMFRIWEARTPSIPAIRFHAHHTRANAWRKWKAAMPGAMKRKQARDHDRFVLLAKSLEKWRERYKTKVSLKAVARARYLRLPPAPAKQATSRMLLIKPRNSTSTSTSAARSYRSASPEREQASLPLSIGARPSRGESSQAFSPAHASTPTPAHAHTPTAAPLPARAESSRAPSPTSTRASFQGFGLAGLAMRRPVFGVPSGSGIGGRGGGGGGSEKGGAGSVDGRSRSSWDGYGTTRARARAAFSAAPRPSSVYQESRGDESD